MQGGGDMEGIDARGRGYGGDRCKGEGDMEGIDARVRGIWRG